jgi:3-deoxy-manno-octulosonate cytidylyltransferase (CMP-KDO synthetase)
MSFNVVIPARLGSKRLPGKVLLDIAGKPMLQHTYEKAKKSEAKQVFIATDDDKIKTVAIQFGAKVIMTDSGHNSGTERIQQAASELNLDMSEIIVNVQADEPLIPPSAIDQVASNLESNKEAGVSTLCERIFARSEIEDPNTVKVVINNNNEALYFSRAAIPYGKNLGEIPCYRHIGIYGYRVEVLNSFVRWPISELEKAENLEQLRALHNGIKIHVGITNLKIPPGVDTKRDLEVVQGILS